jgi:hypothetical protein
MSQLGPQVGLDTKTGRLNVRRNVTLISKPVNELSQKKEARVEEGPNTSTVALRIIGGDEKGTQFLGYNWVTLPLGDRLGESRVRDSKIWS